MGLRKENITCFCFLLLLLMLLQLETSCTHAGKAGRFGRLKGGSVNQANINGHGFGRDGDNDKDDDGGDVFGVDKRKIHTGPNPLHNR